MITTTFLISRELLPQLRMHRQGDPLQGLLLGRRAIAPNGILLTATRIIPFHDVGSHLGTLINHYLYEKLREETVLGWCLQIDRECQIMRVATAYFECFYRQLVRAVLANVQEDQLRVSELAEELADFLAPITGLIVVREVGESYMAREFCAYKCKVNTDYCLELINEVSIMALDLIAGADAHSLMHFDNLDGFSCIAIDEVMDQLRAEKLGASTPFSSWPDEESQSKRKTRHRRRSLASNHDVSVRHTPKVLPIDVQVISGEGNRLYESLSMPLTSSRALIDESLTMAIKTKEALLQQIHDERADLVESYEKNCREYELLSLVYKVIAQPDDVLMKKLSNLEDYEERMRKLGTKLKHSLSPEDLLRTLVSIKPTDTLPSS